MVEIFLPTSMPAPSTRSPRQGANKSYTDTKLSKTGGVMTDMNNKRIYNLAQVNGDNQPANKIYSDNKFLSKTGDVMAGNLNLSNNRIIIVGAPTSQKDGVNKEWAESNFLKLSGGHITGDLSAASRPGVHNESVLNFINMKYFFIEKRNPYIY